MRGTSSRISFRERSVTGAYLARLARLFCDKVFDFELPSVLFTDYYAPNTVLRRLTK